MFDLDVWMQSSRNVAICGGDSVCIIDCETGIVHHKYKSIGDVSRIMQNITFNLDKPIASHPHLGKRGNIAAWLSYVADVMQATCPLHTTWIFWWTFHANHTVEWLPMNLLTCGDNPVGWIPLVGITSSLKLNDDIKVNASSNGPLVLVLLNLPTSSQSVSCWRNSAG